jgi:hypothetical protein
VVRPVSEYLTQEFFHYAVPGALEVWPKAMQRLVEVFLELFILQLAFAAEPIVWTPSTVFQ